MSVPTRPVDPHDRLWLERVRPPDWVNPPPAKRYNLVVVGGGTAGLVCAAGAAGLGARVALVESGLLGGDCLNTGCVPSKALLSSARMAAERQAARGSVDGSRVPRGDPADFGAAMERMRRIRAEIAAHDSAARFRDLGVDVFFGAARFIARDTVEVEGSRLRFARAVIATGARPTVPGIPGLSEAGYLTSESVFDLTALPPRLAVVGGGPIGCELAQAFARFGSGVVVLEREERLLPSEDPDVGDAIRSALSADGVELALGAMLVEVERTPSGSRLAIDEPAGRRSVEVDAILIAAGRSPNVAGLDLDAAGIELDGRGRIRADDRLRTTNRRVYVAGDVVGGRQFTHLADAHARIVLRNALFHGRAKADALRVPECTFTDPEVARVGHTLASASAAGVGARAFVQPFDTVDRPRIEGEERGFARVLVEERSDTIVGATIVGRHAGELIALVALAIESDVGLADLASIVWPYPTRAQVLGAVANQYQRSRLTPRNRRILARWMAWRR
ncbi:MAG TPA: mercuric reductase [Gemmatimonadota bacterium]|nr:mercuric reductase [Gemmatimonadota bacterium]